MGCLGVVVHKYASEAGCSGTSNGPSRVSYRLLGIFDGVLRGVVDDLEGIELPFVYGAD